MIEKQSYCPECESTVDLDRRTFLNAVGGTAVTLVGLQAVGSAPHVLADTPAPAAARQAKPAEALIRELYSGLTDAQKTRVCYAWDHRQGNQSPTRLRMYNAAIGTTIGDGYTPAQQELVQRILRSICSGEEGYRLISRANTFDGSRSFERCGAYIFGNPSGDNQFSWVFTGHHLTVRCDGNSEQDAAFGGPMYYGHSPDGWSQRNLFFPQTRAVKEVFDSLNENQRRQALVGGNPGEQEGSVRFRARGQAYPGLAASELTADQRRLVETVMRTILAPYRQEDADEVMQLVRRNGGLERLHFAFYREGNNDDRWSFWRIEGPGFVWNFRVLPHVHTFVNIGVPRQA